MTDGDLAARVAALEIEVRELRALVEQVRGEPRAESPDDVWRRLGLAEGERRIVTVLFADVSGFTALSEQLDAEAFQLVMRDTMTLLAGCATEEGGTLEKFIGDALCALFGAPVSHPDEPERAARAALAMHEALAARAASRPDLPPLQVHVGINTGPVIAGGVGDGSQFGVMGDTINTASRLMNLATAGETFVSAPTARRLRHAFRLEDRGTHEVKGKQQPLATWALLEALSMDERAASRRLRAPLVGRDGELATLRAVADRVAAGDGAAVVLVGEPGAGATRLAHELGERLADVGWRVLSSSARVHAETPLGFVATALGPLLGERPGRLAGGTAGPLAETLLGVDAAAPHDFELVLGEVVVAAAAEAPLLVVLDDADAADPGSVEVLRYLSRSTDAVRVLWLLTAEQVPAPFRGGGDVVVVPVPPLDDDAVGELFEALFPRALTPAQRARLAHLADGNVQYALEIALALLDDGVVVELEEGRWQAVGDVDAVELPGSVAELVEARIDQLSSAARITLLDAAVIGLRFSGRLLARVATIPASVDAALAELEHEELVVPGDTGMWSFRSRLVREIAYGCVLRRRRPAVHRAVADALLALEPEHARDNADLVAHHLEMGDDPPLAVPHLLQAIDRAEAAYNVTGALDRARRALRLRDRYPGRVRDEDAAWLLQRVGINSLLLGNPSGLNELEAAVDLLGSAGAPAAAVADLEERVGWYLTAAGQPDAGAPHLDRAEALDADAVSAAVAATRALAIAGSTGDLAGARSVLGDAVERAEGFAAARARLVEGLLELWSGDAESAVGPLRSALELSWAGVHASIADRCGRWLVTALVDAGRGAEADAVARPILARADDRGDPTVACSIRVALARWRLVAGDAAGAAMLAEEAGGVAAGGRVAPDAVAELHLLRAALAADPASAARQRAAALAAHGHGDWLAWRTSGAVTAATLSP